MFPILLAFIVGLVAQKLFGLDILWISWIEVFIYSLLGLGLYGAVYGIEMKFLKENKTLVILAVTIWVIFKALFVGSLLYLVYPTPYSFLLGIVVAQIDPLSVAHLEKMRALSPRWEAVLRAWSSFDDPMTVLLVMYVWVQFIDKFHTDSGLSGYFTQMMYNFVLFAAVFFAYFYTIFHKNKIYEIILLIVAFFVGIKFILMLAVASLGLFLRPDLQKALIKVVAIAFLLSVVILGNAVEFSWWAVQQGITLWVLAYCSQIVCGIVLTRWMSGQDRWGLSLAQFNGITSIILALFLELTIPGTTGIVVFAILTINAIYVILHKVFARKIFV